MPKENLEQITTAPRIGPEEVYVTLHDLIKLQYEAGGFSFLPKYAVQSILSGRHRSKLRGRGLDFDEVREYILGDDIRNIDWKVTARTGVTHTKEFTEEKERPVFFIVDQSQSMFFGSGVYFKSVLAAHIAALGCWRTIDVGDRVGGLVFNNEKEAFVKPQRNRKTLQQFLSLITDFNQELQLVEDSPSTTNPLEDAISKANQFISHDFLVVVITDLNKINDKVLKEIIHIRQNNDVIVAPIYDPLEQDLNIGDTVITDGHFRLKLKENSELLNNYKKEIVNLSEKLEAKFKTYAIPYLLLSTMEQASVQLRTKLSSVQRGR